METLTLYKNHYLTPDWPAPKTVKAYSTTRQHGHSLPPFNSFNLGDRTEDNPQSYLANRQQLIDELALTTPITWLKQVHGTQAVCVNQFLEKPEADASFASVPHQVCVVGTADCLPLLVCNNSGTEVAAIHAGWRGLAAGVIESTLKQLQSPGKELLVWLGPAIGPTAFEVGDEVREQFLKHDQAAHTAFQATTHPGKWLANLYLLAQQRLQYCGVEQIFGGNFCTFTSKEHFFSYRRDKGITGRMVSLIWLT